jgi:transitional endoplasmic reticulum ATPase
MKEITLKIAEASQRHVGKGIAVVDPKIVEDNNWKTGQILELVGNRKSHVKLWPGSAEDYGTGIIKIDGIMRHNISSGIGEKISVKRVDAAQAEQVTLSPIEKLSDEGFQEYMQGNYIGHVLTTGDTLIVTTQLGGRTQLVVTNTTPSAKPVLVTELTQFKLGSMTKAIDSSIPRVTYDELGGLRHEVQKIHEMVELPMRHPELFEKLGVEAPKGVLLYGPPGTGKTLLAKAVAGETNSNFTSISGPEIIGKFYGESEERLREIFKQAEENAPSIIFIDEIDSIAPKREEVTGEVEKRIVSQLLTLMDGMKPRGKVVVIAATNRPDSLDPALRRPGRFDREIEIGIPDQVGRKEILDIHTRGMPIEEKVNLDQIAKVTHGFVGADLEILAKEAAMRSLRRILPEVDLEEEKIPAEILQKIVITDADFKNALKEVRPSVLREVLVQVPNVSWEDVGGLESLKEELHEAVEWPLKHKEAFEHTDVSSPKGVLLYGPPGTGKTLIAKAVAHTTESNFISIKGPELLSKWIGESEKGVREVFRKARQAAPCIIFLDELDSLAPSRGYGSSDSNVTERVVSQLLTEIDGLEELHNVLVIGATNRVDLIDNALLRPGRFDRILEVPLPDTKGRENIFKIHTKKKPLADGVNFVKLVELTDGFNGAEIEGICNRAAMSAIRRYVNKGEKSVKSIKVTQEDFENAIEKILPGKIKQRQTMPSQLI